MLVGLPGTGKSTFRTRLKQETCLEFLTISSDDYIDNFAKNVNKTYNEVFKDYVGEASKLIEADARMAKIKEFNVVWDQTNLSSKKRKIILDKFDSYVKIAVVFEIPEDWAWRLYKRVGSEGKYIPLHVLKNMQDNYEAPSMTENFDYIYDSCIAIDYIKKYL